MNADRFLPGGIGIDIGPVSVACASVAGGQDRGSRAEAARGPHASLEAVLAALGLPPGERARPAWIAWSHPDVAVERVEVATLTPAGLGRLLTRAGPRDFVAVLSEGPRIVLVRWDQAAVTDAVAAAGRAGFDVVGCAPGPCARVWGAGDAALGAARAAAGLVRVRPLCPPAAPVPVRPDRPWVLERIEEHGPEAPPCPLRWRRPWSGRAR